MPHATSNGLCPVSIFIKPSGLDQQARREQAESKPPVKLTGAVAASLTTASSKYAMVMPYLLPMARPQCDFEPITESFIATGIPSEHVFLELPSPIFDLGRRGHELGLHGAVLHGIPRHQWDDFVTFVKSCAFFDQESNDQFVLGVQKLQVIDPMWQSTKAEDPRVKIYAIVVADKRGMVYWEPNKHVSGYVKQYTVATTAAANAGSGITLMDAFTSGDNDPFTKVENVHGLKDLVPPKQ